MKKLLNPLYDNQIQSMEMVRKESPNFKNRWELELHITIDNKVKKHYLGYFDPGFFQYQSSEVIPKAFIDTFEELLLMFWKKASTDLLYKDISFENRINYAQFKINKIFKEQEKSNEINTY